MTVPAGALDAGQFAAQYELLRAQIIGTPRDMACGRKPNQPRGVGLALLLREGMPGWLRAVQVVLRGSLLPAACASGTGGMPPAMASWAAAGAVPKPFAHPQLHDITILLASLVLSTRRAGGVSASEKGYRPCP